MEAACSSETLLSFNGLHGVISQKIGFFITTAVKTPNPTFVRQFVEVFVFQGGMWRDARVLAQTHNTSVKAFNELTDCMEKIRLKTGKRF
jgi:hypothetical protein